MQFTCQHQAFVQGIATVERAVSNRDIKPVLTGILLEAQENRLRLAATDLELGVECFVPAQVQETGSAVIEGKVLSQIVRKLDAEEVRYTTAETGVAKLEGGKARFTLHTMPADEFPNLPAPPAGTLWRMPQKAMRRMIRQTIFAAATDDARPSFTGILVEVENDEVRMVATDVSRLAFRRSKLLEPAAEISSAIVPAGAMQELMRILSAEGDSEVQFIVADNQAVFRMGEVTLVTRLLEGQFPDYRRAFPQDQPTRVRLKRTEFLAAVERASLIARRSVPPVVLLQAGSDHLAISSREAEVGQVYEEVPATNEGAEGEATYQAYFLMEALRAIDVDEVYMELGQGLRQGSIRPVGDSEYLYVLMPVRVG